MKLGKYIAVHVMGIQTSNDLEALIGSVVFPSVIWNVDLLGVDRG